MSLFLDPVIVGDGKPAFLTPLRRDLELLERLLAPE
jgi:hypothetical protein